MSRYSGLLVAIIVATALLASCSGGENPSSPDSVGKMPLAPDRARSGQTHLWGYYDVYVDIAGQTATAVPNRGAMFTANVVNFINSKPAGLSFHINSTPSGPDYVDVDIDVSITHPFPGLQQYNGYDVRGVFMGDGSRDLQYNGDLVCAVKGTDQSMLPDEVDGYGGPDGYTRWYNKPEFSTGGMPLFQYTPGKMASPGFSGSATLNPYRYFADGLDVNEDLWSWLLGHADQHGLFSSGATNTRNYYLRFPTSKGVKYGYAIIATWSGVDPDQHPSNAPEAVACLVDDTNSTVYYAGPSENGGDLILDVNVWDWDAFVSAGVMEDYRILIESTVLTTPYEFDTSDMTPVGGNENYSTFHVEIPADSVQGLDGNEYWVIVEEKDADYKNDYGITNLAGDDPLAAFFRFDLDVGTEIPAWIQVTSPNGGEKWVPGIDQDITWTSSGVTGTVFIDYSDDNFVSDLHSIDTDVPNTGSYQWTIPCHPSDTFRVRVSSTDTPGINDVSDGDFAIVGTGWAEKWGDTGYEEGRGVAFDPDGNVYIEGTTVHVSTGRNWAFVAKFSPCGELLWSKSWGGNGLTQGYGVAVDSDGNCYCTGNFYGTTDFDPDDPGGPAQRTSVGSWDAWLVSFDSTGDFRWVRTWGGTYSDSGQGVVIDDSGGLYIAGFFCRQVDFDPDGGDVHWSNADSFDPFVCKYDTTGDYKWAQTWGSPFDDRAFGVATGGSNVYVTGYFWGSDVNFDPDGSHLLSSNGGEDVFLSAFDSSKDFQWAYNWGGTAGGIQTDEGLGVAADDSGNVYATGYFRGYNVNFDPGGWDPHSSNIGGRDAYLSKFNAAGSFQWARTWGGSSMDAGEGVAVDGSGNVYVDGWFYGTGNFDPNGTDERTTPSVYEDGYMSKFNASGTYQWVHSWGSVMNDRALGIGCDSSNNVCTTGFINGPANLAPGDGPCSEPADNVVPAGGADAFLIRFLPDGCW